MRFNLIHLLLASCSCSLCVILGTNLFGERPLVFVIGFILGLVLFVLFSWLVALLLWKLDEKKRAKINKNK